MNDTEINKLVETLNEKGYFKLHYGNVKRFNKYYNGFEELQPTQFRQHLAKEYLSQKDANEYASYIITQLDDFPLKQFKNYDNYLRLKNEKPFSLIEKDFMIKFYNQNDKLKKPDVKLRAGSLEVALQVLINNDVFYTNHKTYRQDDSQKLYQYDVSNKSFVRVNGDNIGTVIGCDSPSLSNDVLTMALKYGYTKLINILDTVAIFERTRNNEERIKDYTEDYNYINNLIESLKAK